MLAIVDIQNIKSDVGDIARFEVEPGIATSTIVIGGVDDAVAVGVDHVLGHDEDVVESTTGGIAAGEVGLEIAVRGTAKTGVEDDRTIIL